MGTEKDRGLSRDKKTETGKDKDKDRKRVTGTRTEIEIDSLRGKTNIRINTLLNMIKSHKNNNNAKKEVRNNQGKKLVNYKDSASLTSITI
jgi:hypothetical protein